MSTLVRKQVEEGSSYEPKPPRGTRITSFLYVSRFTQTRFHSDFQIPGMGDVVNIQCGVVIPEEADSLISVQFDGGYHSLLAMANKDVTWFVGDFDSNSPLDMIFVKILAERERSKVEVAHDQSERRMLIHGELR